MPAVATAGGLPTRLGKYEIMMPLAAGGMALIYIARTTGIGMFERHVVLKLITPERANDVVAVQMFLDEARLAASLNHQNVAQVFEVGEDGGIHYLAMEYVHGQDLRALLAKAGHQGTRVPLELALTVVAGAAAGLNHAHERHGPDGKPLGIVHRDVSPSNIMVGYDGSVKLLDFGIAKATSRSVETQSGIIKGKFAYMAPEQCRGRDVDRRSDVFSLGIILYEITTQHRCFRADSDFDTMHRIVTGDVVRPTRVVQGYPQALEAIVMKALAVDASTRYQSAGALLEAIESFAVSSRMSLSTMSLGRFMRDMFGDSPEPWLTTTGRASLPLEPKESTISNTNNATAGSAPKGLARRPVEPAVAVAVAVADEDDDEAGDAAQTILMGEDALAAVVDGDDGDASEGLGEGLDASTATATNPELVPRHVKALGLQPIRAVAASPAVAAPQPPPIGTGRPPAGQFPPGSGSSSSPSHSAARAVPAGPGSVSLPVASTRHGYASGSGATLGDTYPPQEASSEASAVHQLTPNRRPLFIGLGLAGVGLIVLLVMALGGGDDAAAHEPSIIMSRDAAEAATATPDPAPTPTPPPSVDPTPTPLPPEPAGPEAKGTAERAPIGESTTIQLDITSEPTGAEVQLAGKVLGTTPLKRALDKGQGAGVLTLRKATFVDATKEVDLRENVTTKLTLKKVSTAPVNKPKPTSGTTKPKQADCQPAGQYNGFDPRPICK